MKSFKYYLLASTSDDVDDKKSNWKFRCCCFVSCSSAHLTSSSHTICAICKRNSLIEKTKKNITVSQKIPSFWFEQLRHH